MKMRALRLTEQRALLLLLIAFAIIAALYSIVTPLFEMSDELWHYPMVKTLADGNGLPIQDPDNPGPWKQEGSQPPLYYYLAAVATTWIDTSDVGEVLRPNPHVDNGIVTPDGNNNLVVHNYAREAWPWRGTVLATHIARLLSVAFGTGAVYFTYRVGLEVFPEKRWVALAGAAAVAFTPMFAFISGAVNNDSLAAMLSALSLWLMLMILREAEANRPTVRWSAALGVALGLAALTKTSTLGLFGLAGLTLAYAAWRQRRWRTFLLEGPLIIILAAAIASWWYYRNWRLYGDPLGLNAFIAILGQRAHPASLIQLWGERFGFMQSYWGLFGGVNIPMPAWAYDVLNAVAIISVIGVVATFVLKAKHQALTPHIWAPALLSMLWIAGVVVPLSLSWARITWSSQGRLVFSAISCISLWFMAGLSYPLPRDFGKWTAGAVLGFMGALTVISPFAWIAPRYELTTQSPHSGDIHAIEFGPRGSAPALRLVDYDIDTCEASPGDSVRLTLHWEAVGAMDRNWSIFVHLQDSAQVLAGQRDTYPGLGLIATQDIEPGFRWSDSYVIPVDPAAYAPEMLSVVVGVYDWASCAVAGMACERMLTNDGDDAVTLGRIYLEPRVSDAGVPNPLSLNFDNELSLIGYSLDARTVKPEETLLLTLYWRGLRKMDANYTISAQLLGPDLQNYGQKDSWPLDGALPTAAWTPGEVVEDHMNLTVSADTPPGLYQIQIVVYTVNEAGEFERLQLVTDDGRLIEDYFLLTDVRVFP